VIIADNVVQGTQEWWDVRLGIPTSSGFDKIITTKGEPSKQRLKYMDKLAVERITRVSEDSYTNRHMERGKELEPQARAFYEVFEGAEVTEVGFCYKDKKKLYGCSPDGLVGDDGLIEIKCPTSAVHVEYMRGKKLPTAYYQQVQGQLLVTGRKWCDFYSFYPGIKPFIVRVVPDKDFIKALEVELDKIAEELNEITKEIGA